MAQVVRLTFSLSRIRLWTYFSLQLTFLGAGHETTASGLTWTLWLLANDISSQEKLRAEVSPVYAKTSRPDYKTLRDMKWLDCVVYVVTL